MTLEIHTLENFQTTEIAEAFNQSFSDYIVPLSLTKDQLEKKMFVEGVQLDLSVGVVEDNKLIAFILHGFDIVQDKKLVYNAGTGVIPQKRGEKLVQKMYDFILPILRQKGVDKVKLEVISSNTRAIKSYKNCGFGVRRELELFRGKMNLQEQLNNGEIKKLENYDWNKLSSFWDIEPSWQNSIPAVERMKDATVSIGFYKEGNLLGYLIFNPETKRIHQFAVEKAHRKQGIGKSLFAFISVHFSNEVSVYNIDSSSNCTLRFLERIGLGKFLTQYEMEFHLS